MTTLQEEDIRTRGRAEFDVRDETMEPDQDDSDSDDSDSDDSDADDTDSSDADTDAEGPS
jgi:hypothetical protein